MRYTLIAYLILVSCSIDGEKESWIKTIGNSSITRPTSQVIDSEGNVYVAGTYTGNRVKFEDVSFTLNGEMNAFLLKIDPTGDPIWSVNLGQKGIVSIQDIDTDEQGNIYALISLSISSLTGDEGEINFKDKRIVGRINTPLIIKISNVGEIEWVKEFPNYNGADLEVLKVSSENIYVGGGLDSGSQLITRMNNYEPNYLSGKIILLSLDLDGDIQRQVFLEGNYIGKVTDIEIISEKSLYISGSVSCPEGITGIINQVECGGYVSLKDEIFSFNDNERGFIAKVENYTISKVKLIGNSIQQGATIRSITTDKNQNIYLSGNYKGELGLEDIFLKSDKVKIGTDENTIYFSKMDSSFNYVWGLTTQGGPGSDYTWDIIFNKELGIIATGDFYQQIEFGNFKLGKDEGGFGNRRMFIAQINNNGKFQKVLTDDAELNSGAVSISILENNLFVVSGFVDGKSQFEEKKFGYEKGSNAFITKFSNFKSQELTKDL